MAITAATGLVLGTTVASAHTDALGYLVSDGSAAGLFNVQIVYGSWHDGNISAEGAVQLNRQDASVVGTQAFSILLGDVQDGTLPTGLTPGQNFFYVSEDGGSLVSTPSNGIYNFQAATFSDVGAGTYTFAYADTGGLTANWVPAGPAVASGTFTLTEDGGVVVPGPANDIDTANPNYASSNLGSSVNPTFAGGTLLIDQDGQTYPNDFALDDTPTNTIDMNGNTTVLSGAFSDAASGTAGVITYADTAGDGQVTLTSASTYTGTTTLDSGTLVLAGAGTLGAETASTIVNGGTLDLGGTDQIQATLTQTGGTVQNGTATVGAFVMAGGVLASDAAINAADSIDVQEGTIDGTLGGSAALTKSGSGTVVLTNENSYSGGTTVNDGTLVLAGTGTLGVINSETTVNGGTLDLGGSTQTQADLSQTGGTIQNGTFAVGSFTMEGGNVDADAVINADDTFTIEDGVVSGVLTGTASFVKNGTQGITLSGANTYTGNTEINGGTVALTGAGTLGAADGGTVITNGTLELGGTTQTQTSFTQGTATVQNGALVLDTYVMDGGTLSSNVTANVNSTIDARSGLIAGTLSGTAALFKTGAGQVNLTAANAYTGGTIIDNGVLSLEGEGGVIGSVVMDDPATLAIDEADGDRAFDTITGSGAIVLGDNTLVLSQASGDFSGSIEGSGGLILFADQGYALNGESTYTGGTALVSGSLSLGNSNALGTGILAMSEFTEIGLTDDGMVLGNDITVSGDPTIFVPAGVTATIAGTISDGTEPGDIVKTGDGVLIFTGNNTYSAGTTISAGILQLGDGGTTGGIVGNVLNNATMVSNRSDDITFGGVISGSGVVEQAGAGTTTLAAINSYTGGTTITAGTLVGTATSFGSGNILNNGALIIDQAADATFANAINGTGSFAKQGAGSLTLTGASGLSGATAVAQGELRVAGSLAASTVTLASGTRLSGTGTVGGIVASSGSTIAPGTNAIGTLNVNGNVTQQAGSLYAVQVTAGSSLSDRIIATGTAAIGSGALLNVSRTNAGVGYALGSRYTVLSAAQGISGTYTLTGETAVSAFYDLVVDYDARNVYLDVAQTSSFLSAGITPNERSVAGALDALAPTVGLRNALGYLQSFEEARGAFRQLSGEIHSSAKSALIQDSQYLRDAVSAHLRAGVDLEEADRPGISLWGHGYGSWGSLAGNGNAGVLHRSARGLLAGVDAPIGGMARIGVMGGYSRSKFNTAGHRDTGHSDNYHLGVYAGTDGTPVNLQVGAAYTWHRLDFDRTVAFTGFADSPLSRYKGNSTQVFGEAGYRIAVNNGYFEPFGQVNYVRLRTDGFVENGGDAALLGRSKKTEVTFSTLGLRGSVDVASPGALQFHWSTGWRHAFGNRTPFTDLRFGEGNQVFGISGAPIAKNAAALQAGIKANASSGLSVDVSYSGQIGRNVQDHGVKGTLTWRF